MATPSVESSKTKFLQHHDRLKASRRHVVILDTAPPAAPLAGTKKCKAKTLEGKPCPFKAVKGCFCSRHSIK